MPLETGLSAVASLVVGDSDLAPAFGSGTVGVLATPRLVALCEQATMLALADRLDVGETTVGMRVQIDHVSPTGPGCRVQAEAVLKAIQGRRLTFEVSASDERGLIAAGKVTRVRVETARFLDKLG